MISQEALNIARTSGIADIAAPFIQRVLDLEAKVAAQDTRLIDLERSAFVRKQAEKKA